MPIRGSLAAGRTASLAAMKAALSRTLRVTAPLEMICTGSTRSAGSPGSRPRVGLSPTRPQAAAGMRMDPPPSLAWARGTAPPATTTALPPEEAPAEWAGSQGLRTGSISVCAAYSVLALKPNSGSRLLPSITTPRSRQWAPTGPSFFAGLPVKAALPIIVGSPLTSTLSLMKTGSPARAPSPRPSRSSRSAWARARS